MREGVSGYYGCLFSFLFYSKFSDKEILSGYFRVFTCQVTCYPPRKNERISQTDLRQNLDKLLIFETYFYIDFLMYL